MSIEAMKQALDLLETCWGCGDQDTLDHWNETAQVLRQAIEQAEKPKTRPATREEKIVNPGVYEVAVHASDISQERVDETAKREHEPAPNDYDRSIHSNPDAQAWAKFFMATVNEQEWCIDDIDESLMTGWFANAMMAMHDHVKREWVGLDGDIPGLGLVTEEFYNGMVCAEEILRGRNT